MKGFQRKNLAFSLCGLNCGLCPMHLNGYCPGCGGGEGNQSCSIAKCSLSHGKVEYCTQCDAYPCEKYADADQFDCIVTTRNRFTHLARAKELGIDYYNQELSEKIGILNALLSNFNAGRRKTFYCVAVNLLELDDLRFIMEQLDLVPEISRLPIKERETHAVQLFQEMAHARNIELKLRKKPKQKT